MKYKIGSKIKVNDKMQKGYEYILEAPMGKNFAKDFKPFFTPKEMLGHGVFEGKYMNDCKKEFPESWFKKAKMSKEANVEMNYFRIKSRQPLQVWEDKGWIMGPDPRGWFQWYCRYYMGRRIPKIDERQIARWRAFARHAAQVKKNCDSGDIYCRPRQRQALLQWSYDPFI